MSMILLNRVGLVELGTERQREVSAAVALRQGESRGVVGAALESLYGGAAGPGCYDGASHWETHISTVSERPIMVRVSFQRVPTA